ncbi:MAG TPA: hypothetical protein PLV68_13635, partial [Ilumatobacteraceae bacterium]|nr:hypothetical protein [Ilumatobacteraceae bacterium]
ALGYHIYRLGTRITPSQGVACASSPCLYADLDAPAAGAWVAPSSVTATTNQTGGVTVSWNLPGRPKGTRQLYEVSAINPAG